MPIEIIPSLSSSGSKYHFSEQTYIHANELPVLQLVASAMPSKGMGNFSVLAVASEQSTIPDTLTNNAILEVVVEGDGNPYVFWALTQDTEHYIENCAQCPIAKVVPDMDCALNKAWNDFRLDTYRQNRMIANWESMTGSLEKKAVSR